MIHKYNHPLENTLKGKLLISMPAMKDPRFAQSVILICGHDHNGAMGLVINKPTEKFKLKELLEQINIPVKASFQDQDIYYGGPVEMGRGFILHSCDVMAKGSFIIAENIALSATTDILKKVGAGKGPQKILCTLGYAGWSAGQLEQEIQKDAWFIVPCQEDLVFDTPFDGKWLSSFRSMGVNPELISTQVGHA